MNTPFHNRVFKNNKLLNIHTVQPLTGSPKTDDKETDTNINIHKPVANFNDKFKELLARNTYLETQFEILHKKYKSLAEDLLSLDEKISSKFEPENLSSSVDLSPSVDDNES